MLKEAIDYGKPDILTDRGTQFYAGGEKKAKGVSKFEKFLLESGIRHIVGRVNHSNEWKGREVLWHVRS